MNRDLTRKNIKAESVVKHTVGRLQEQVRKARGTKQRGAHTERGPIRLCLLSLYW